MSGIAMVMFSNVLYGRAMVAQSKVEYCNGAVVCSCVPQWYSQVA